jgi:hypothetical protein
MRLKRILSMLLVCMVVPVHSWALVPESRIIEEEMLQALKDHCDGLMSQRMNASRNERWRDVFNLARSYVDACRGSDDRFAISRAYEDMGWASMMMDDPKMGLMYVQQCVDGNAFAGGCYARKAQILMRLGKGREAASAAWKGMSRTERAIAIAKQQMAAMKRPDPRAEQYYRTKYLRKREELDGRITGLEDARRTLQDLNEEFDQY